MKKTILLFICMAVSSAVQARMGYTREQCVDQYGSAVEVSGKDRDEFKFKKNGFEIKVWFRDSRVFLIMYGKPGRYSNEQIFEVERDRIVQLNADGRTWAKMECPRKYWDQHLMDYFWRRSDGALAFYNSTTYELAILPDGFDHVVFSDGKAATFGL